MLNRNFSDILSEFSAAGVEYLLVGAYALSAHRLPRATGGIDLWVRPSRENAQRIMAALARFGAPLADVSAADFEAPGVVFQIGVIPQRIDILTEISGVEFDQAWQQREYRSVDGHTVPVLGRVHLVQNKRAAARPKDVLDADWLEEQER